LIVLAMIRSTARTSALDILWLSSLPWCQHQPHLSGCQARGLAAFGKRSNLPGMILDLTDEETDALAGLLRRTIDDDRYPLSPRVQTAMLPAARWA
jgi:crotonobetainyl-CoA:carnitine CoA-transferase CaiB-like acyl-CoA transferase